jgi:two-component system, OmpR family, alkaline phosphatase synthesis response regulator PhoP
MAEILIVDDDQHIREVVRFALQKAGHGVREAADGEAALRAIAEREPDLIVLDIVMPEQDGLSTCRAIRARSRLPIIFLSSRDEELDRVLGLELGGDDYMSKPFSPRELVARVKALLRRGSGEVMSRDLLTFDDGVLEIDAVRHEVRVGGRRCDVTPSEYKLLMALADRPGRVYSRAELAYRARGHDFVGYERTVDAHIKNLRRKIEEDPANPRYVETVRGVGYRLGVEPT